MCGRSNICEYQKKLSSWSKSNSTRISRVVGAVVGAKAIGEMVVVGVTEDEGGAAEAVGGVDVVADDAGHLIEMQGHVTRQAFSTLSRQNK